MPDPAAWTPDDFPCGCLVTSAPKGRGGRTLEYVNTYVEQLFGLPRHALIGRQLSTVLTRASNIMVDSYLLPMLLHDGTCTEIMLDIRGSKERVIPVMANAVLCSKDDDRIIWSLFNATRRSQLDQELVDARQKLQEYSDTLYTLAITDDLTGLVNGRELRRRAAQLVAQARRSHSPVSVIVLDVDNFKLINDSQGHMAGDDILKRLGQILADHARESDVVARYGGEEFCLVLPDTSEASALAFVRRLHGLIGNIRFDDKPLTISAGVASTESLDEDAASYERLFGLADDAMYRAKEAGRNRTEVARP